MPILSAFRGLRYDLSAVSDLSAVLCPPYDVISPAERNGLAARHPRNAVHLELPESYEAAARALDAWFADGTLARDPEPLIYAYEQAYRLPDGTARVARSIFCRLRLEEYGPHSGVRPHERTMSGPKEDRFRLLTAVQANLSPVLLLYDDGVGGSRSAELLDAVTATPPAATAVGPGGIGQRLWAIDPAFNAEAAELLAVAAGGPLTIADGHHRYETALRFRDAAGAPPGADHVLASLYDAHSGGLALLPWHRLIGGAGDTDAVFSAASELFDARPVGSADELLAHLAVADEPGTLGIWTRGRGALVVRTTREPARELDVSVLSATLGQMIGSTESELAAAGRLDYVSNAREAVVAVDSGRVDVCFLLRPTPVESVLEVAASGGFMPPKSTYFHPKAATGLIFNSLAG